MAERRNFSRVLFHGEAELHFEGKSVRGVVENLSLKGMLVQHSELYPVGTPLAIRIQLTGSTAEVSIRLTGQVIRHQEEDMAIEFTGMDLDSFILLKNVVIYNSGSEEKILDEFNNYMKLRSQSEN
jgi:hypothetical protein